MASLAEAIKDKRGFPDDQKVALGNGLEITLGELRQFQEASGQDVAKQLEAERSKLAGEQAAVAKAQEEVVALWTKLQEQSNKQPPRTDPTPGSDWRKDPFFAPIAEYLSTTVEAQQNKQAEQIAQFQKALGLGVKYITDTLSEMRYSALPEEFRKETPYESAVKSAAERKFLDSGGVPDIRKVYEEWERPRAQKSQMEKMREEIRTEERQKALQSSIPRPGGMPTGSTGAPDPNAPKTIRESFQKLKEDPAFIEMVYGMGQGNA
jgi:hypothetical protein